MSVRDRIGRGKRLGAYILGALLLWLTVRTANAHFDPTFPVERLPALMAFYTFCAPTLLLSILSLLGADTLANQILHRPGKV